MIGKKTHSSAELPKKIRSNSQKSPRIPVQGIWRNHHRRVRRNKRWHHSLSNSRPLAHPRGQKGIPWRQAEGGRNAAGLSWTCFEFFLLLLPRVKLNPILPSGARHRFSSQKGTCGSPQPVAELDLAYRRRGGKRMCNFKVKPRKERKSIETKKGFCFALLCLFPS